MSCCYFTLLFLGKTAKNGHHSGDRKQDKCVKAFKTVLKSHEQLLSLFTGHENVSWINNLELI